MTSEPGRQAGAAPPTLNVANALTALRLVLVPVFVVVFMHDGASDVWWRAAATGVFLLASLTDQLDGHLARSRNLVTDFGKIADPIADKALIGAALVCLSWVHLVSWAVTGVILGRELAVTLIRVAVIRHAVIPASKGGKVKTAVQITAITGFLLPAEWINRLPLLAMAVVGLLILAVAITVATGVDYAFKSAGIVKAARRAAAERPTGAGEASQAGGSRQAGDAGRPVAGEAGLAPTAKAASAAPKVEAEPRAIPALKAAAAPAVPSVGGKAGGPAKARVGWKATGAPRPVKSPGSAAEDAAGAAGLAAAPPAAAPDPALASQAAPAPLPGAGSRQNSQVDAEAPGQRRPRIPFRKVASAGASGPGAGKDKAPSSVGPVAQSAADLKAGPDARVGAGLSNRSARTAAAASAAASAPGPQIGAPGRGPVDHTEKVATAGAAAAAGSSVATSGVDKAPAAKGAAATGAAKTGAGLSPPEAASPEAVKPTRPVEGWPDAGTVKPPARPAPRPSAGSRAAPEWAQLRTVMRAAETGDVSDSPTHPGEPAHKAPPPAASVVAPAPSPSAAARPLTGDNQPASPRGARAPRPAVGASVPRPAASASVPRPAAGVTASKAAAGAPAANPPDGAASAAPSGIGAVNQAGRTASAVGASVPRPAAGVTASKPAAGAPAPNPPDGAVSAAPSGAGAVNQAGRTASGGGAVDPAVAQAEVRLAELKRRIGWGDA